MFPKAFRIYKHRKLPYEKGKKSHNKQGRGIKAPHKHHGRKHHKMIPVENTAGGTASVPHNKTEGTPYKHTYKIAYVKGDAY